MRWKRYSIFFFVFLLLGGGFFGYLFWKNTGDATEVLPVLPNIVGYGAATKGGAGGKVYTVTTLDPSGPGSLREAVEAKGPRIVTFGVSGEIDLQREPLYFNQPNLTVFGQTAYGGGITIKNGQVQIVADDIILQHLRIRPGVGAFATYRSNGTSLDGLTIFGSNIVLDHLSISWGTDENLDIYSGQNITIQNSIISEALNCVPEPNWHDEKETCHSKSVIIGHDGATNITFARNIIAHGFDRNPLIQGGRIDFVNNLVYNYGGPFYANPVAGPILANVIGNVYIPGANTVARALERQLTVLGTCAGKLPCYASQSQIYFADNVQHNSQTKSDQAASIACSDRGICLPQAEQALQGPTPVWGVASVLPQVLKNAGASIPFRDSSDDRIVQDIQSQTGTIINTPEAVGG
jgi:pectate lyase